MNLGSWQLDTVDGGTFSIDGGVVYGVVPKTLWQNVNSPDEQNRLQFRNNCVLARDGNQTILIDTGYGGKHLALDRRFYEMDEGEPLLRSLDALGVGPDDIDLVVLSHLHFDHAGGATRNIPGRGLAPTFGRARHLVGWMEWEDALSGAPEIQSAYPQENLTPLLESANIELLQGDESIVPGLRARLTGGHTRGHLAFMFESDGQTALYLGDLCATTTHLHPMWNLSYDTFPLQTRTVKPKLLTEACDGQWWVLWTHDMKVAAGRLTRHPKRGFQVVEPQERL
ncbi:MAG: MBL fold metallo-hydrolase [Pirellulales bacterium]|nr:MBL fold metallo-hydrolase [Pirellulales bacterium]